MDEEGNKILDKAIEKAIKKRIEEKREEIDEDESSDESDNACGATEKVFKQDDKKLRQCINAVECEGCDYFEHCSNDKIDRDGLPLCSVDCNLYFLQHQSRFQKR